jgi:deleted-in-malignant-brain-tumors protein 1
MSVNYFFLIENNTGIETKLERKANDKQFQGRVIVGLNGAWGAICSVGWDMNDAHVICRQLGYFGARSYSNSSKYGRWTGRVWLRNLQCTGTERSINNCSHDGWGIAYFRYGHCNLNTMASVTCNGKKYRFFYIIITFI